MIDLMPHNQYTFTEVQKIFADNNRCCCVQATGTGKSYQILAVLEWCQESGQKAILFAPNNDILEQTAEHFENYNIFNTELRTYQSLLEKTDEEIAAFQVDIIICDEFHHLGAEKWGEKIEILLKTHPNIKMFGTSATAIRGDGIDVAEEWFDGNKACDISLAQAFVRGIIPVMPKYVTGMYTFDEEIYKREDKIKNGNKTIEEKNDLQNELNAIKTQLEKSLGVPDIIKKHIDDYNGKYIVFCKDTEHLMQMKNIVISWFKDAGYFGEIYDYSYYTSGDIVIKEGFDNFCNDNHNGLRLLFVIDKLNEGVHFDKKDNIKGCILLRATQSNIIYYQQIGRVIDASTKEQRIILDLVANVNNMRYCNLRNDLDKEIDKRKRGDYNKFGDGKEFEFNIESFGVVDYVEDVVKSFELLDKKLNNRWSNDEIEILKKIYPNDDSVCSECQKLLNKELKVIRGKAERLHLKKNNVFWTDEQLNILKKYYPEKGSKYVAKIINKSEKSVKSKAIQLHIKRDIKWTKEEDEILKKYYNIEKKENICKILPNRTWTAIKNRALKLSVKTRKTKWDNNEIEILKKYYPIEGKKVIERLPNRTVSQCMNKAFQLNIKRVNKPKYVYKKNNSYFVQLKINKKNKRFGTYNTKEEAINVARKKAKEYDKPWIEPEDID